MRHFPDKYLWLYCGSHSMCKRINQELYCWYTVRLCKVNSPCPCSFPGIVKQDPVLPDDKPLPPPPPRAKSAIFEDEEKSKVARF